MPAPPTSHYARRIEGYASHSVSDCPRNLSDVSIRSAEQRDKASPTVHSEPTNDRLLSLESCVPEACKLISLENIGVQLGYGGGGTSYL